VRSLFVYIHTACVLSVLAASGCSPVVGGACVPGAIVCDGRCVDPRADEANCGACGAACDEGQACVVGHCALQPADGSVPDAWVPDARVPGDGGPVDAGVPDAGTPDVPVIPPDGGPMPDGGDPDAGPLTCDLGTEPCDGECVDVGGDVRHCGACGRACAAAQFCADGECVDICGRGTVPCGSECVDPTSDPDNCGACGRACPTGICETGTCTGALAGHVVVVGHSFEVNRAAMDRVLGNAVFLSPARPVRILPFEGTAASASMSGARRAIDGTAAAMGRAVRWQASTDEARLPAGLADADVLLVHAQVGGADADIDRMGAAWSLALGTFLARGGVVVVLDAMASHRGTWGVLEAAGLLSARQHEDATFGTVRIVAPGDGVAIGVPLTYRAEPNSVRFVDIDLPVVAADGTGPVVVHRTVVP
jgi:hypothetical protein